MAEYAKISSENLPYISKELHILDLAVWITLIIIATYIMIRFAKHKLEINSTFFYADVSNQQYRTLLKIGMLPYYAEIYEFSASSFVESVHLTNGLLPTLNIKWPALKIQNKILKSENLIVFSAKPNPFTTYKLRKILKDEFDLLIFTRNSNSEKFQVINLKGTPWEKIHNRDAIESTSHNSYV
jgi:hypothetical protein